MIFDLIAGIAFSKMKGEKNIPGCPAAAGRER